MATYELGACPACAEQGHRVLADREAIKTELEVLWRFHLRRQRSDVPTEHLQDRTFFSQDPPLQLVECAGCQTVYRNPRESTRGMVETYASERPAAAVLQGLFEAHRASYRTQARLLTQIAGRAGTGLELGSYVGGFLAAASEHGWRFEGVDVNAYTNAFAREQGFSVGDGALEDVPAGRSYDAIAIWNVFDQLPDPRATLAAAATHLSAAGVLAIRVPNGACYARFHHAARQKSPARLLLAYNNLLGFPYRQGFTPNSLRGMLERSGYKVLHLQTDTLVPVADAWTRWWAAWEERLVKGMLRVLPLRDLAPWFEIYARKE